MTARPEDIARQVVAEILGGADPATVDGPMVGIVAAAIAAAESRAMERCAKIADRLHDSTWDGPGTGDIYRADVGDAIRSSINPPAK